MLTGGGDTSLRSQSNLFLAADSWLTARLGSACPLPALCLARCLALCLPSACPTVPCEFRGGWLVFSFHVPSSGHLLLQKPGHTLLIWAVLTSYLDKFSERPTVCVVPPTPPPLLAADSAQEGPGAGGSGGLQQGGCPSAGREVPAAGGERGPVHRTPALLRRWLVSAERWNSSGSIPNLTGIIVTKVKRKTKLLGGCRVSCLLPPQSRVLFPGSLKPDIFRLLNTVLRFE